MTKAEVILKLQEIIGEEKVSKAEAGRIWDAIIEMIEEEVKKGGEIKFGSLFKVFKKHRAARVAYNPNAGKKINVPEKDVLGVKVLSKGKTLFS